MEHLKIEASLWRKEGFDTKKSCNVEMAPPNEFLCTTFVIYPQTWQWTKPLTDNLPTQKARCMIFHDCLVMNVAWLSVLFHNVIGLRWIFHCHVWWPNGRFLSNGSDPELPNGVKNYAPSNNWMVWRSVSIKNSNSCVLSCFITISTNKSMGFYQLLPFWILLVILLKGTRHTCGFNVDIRGSIGQKIWPLRRHTAGSVLSSWMASHAPAGTRSGRSMALLMLLGAMACQVIYFWWSYLIMYLFILVFVDICCVWIYTYGNIETALGECIFKLFNVFMHILVVFEYIDRIETHV